MKTLIVCCAALLAAGPLTMRGQVSCKPPVIEDSQKLDSKGVNQPAGTADLPSVIASVKAAMQCYQDNRGNGADALPKLTAAAFDFKTTTGTVGGLSFSIFIFKFGASKEKDTVNDLSLTYSLPTPKTNKGLVKSKPQELSDALANEILAAANAVQTSQTVLGLPLSKVSVNVQFGIKFDGNASLSLPVQLVTLGPNVDHNRTNTQSVTLTFGN
jgi:hypothetical protein